MIALGLTLLALAAGPAHHHHCHWSRTRVKIDGHTSTEWVKRCRNSIYIFRSKQPAPDAAPAAGGKAVTMLPLCAPLPGVPRGWWVAERVGGQIVCTGPNR